MLPFPWPLEFAPLVSGLGHTSMAPCGEDHHPDLNQRQKQLQLVTRGRRPRPTSRPRPWSSRKTTAVLLSLCFAKCQGFALSNRIHHTAAISGGGGGGGSVPRDGFDGASSSHRRHPDDSLRLFAPSSLLQQQQRPRRRQRRQRRPPQQQRQAWSECSPSRRYKRARSRATMTGARRNGGYGRFDDANDDEPAYYPSPSSGRDWQEIGNADVLVPEDVNYPLGVVHFVGGQGVGMFPRNAYGALLEGLVDAGFLVVATRVRLNEFNHDALACDVARDFRVAYRDVEALYGRTAMARVPLFGVGHSLGAKIHVLLNCYPEVVDVAKRRKANVIISFNNFPASESVPFINELRELGLSMGSFGPLGENLSGIAKAVAGIPLVSGFATQAEEWAPKAAAAVGSALSDVPQEFNPSPKATWELLTDRYSVRNNLVLQFRRDTIDESPQLAETLFNRFGRDGDLEFSRLDGTHVTPNTPDFRDTRQARDWASKAGMGAQGDAFIEGGAKAASLTASLELDELIKTVTSYLRAQSLWVRREGRWDNDEM